MSDAFSEFNTGSGFTLGGVTGGSWYVIPGTNSSAVAGEDEKSCSVNSLLQMMKMAIQES